MIIADRIGSEDREYQSTKYTLNFKWSQTSDIPESGLVVFEDGNIKSFSPSSQWHAHEEARKDVIAQVEQYIERNLEK